MGYRHPSGEVRLERLKVVQVSVYCWLRKTDQAPAVNQVSECPHGTRLRSHGQRPNGREQRFHANNKTKRRFLPNLQYRRFWVESENRWVRLRVSSAAFAPDRQKWH